MRLPAASFQFYLEAKQAAAETFLSAQMEAVYEGRLAAELQRERRAAARSEGRPAPRLYPDWAVP